MIRVVADLADHLQGGTPISTMSEMATIHGLESLGAYSEEVPVVGIMKACMKRKYKVASAEPSESSLLIEDRADISAELVDDLENIQARRVLLPHEVNGRTFSCTQGAQDIVIIMARVVVGRLGADGSLKKRRRRLSWEAILNITG